MSTTPIIPQYQKKKRKTNYINNVDFYNALLDYKILCNAAEKEHKKLVEEIHADNPVAPIPPIVYPRISDYVGECIYLIANKLANAPNFRNYSYRDEMINDGIEDCILRIRSFDPNKSQNAFAYFTQVCYYAAVRRIKKEKKETTIKSELIKNSGILETFDSVTQDADNSDYINSYKSFLLDNIDIVKTDAERAQDARPVIKKTTKAHQKRLKDLEEKQNVKTIDDYVAVLTDDLDTDIVDDGFDMIKEFNGGHDSYE